MKKVLVITGPTAVGKSDLAVDLSILLNGEVISGDSIQVYRGFDIGSGKITEEEMKGIIHHNLDVLDPKENYSVALFQKQAREAIDAVSARGKLPVLCGGTGLYLKACFYDYEFETDSKELDLTLYEKMTNEELVSYLKEKDEKSLETIHPNNRKRLIRACAIASTGKTKTESIEAQKKEMIYDTLILGLTCDRALLYERINQRVRKMQKNGLKQEIEHLLSQGISFEDQSMQGIGYKEWKGYFEGTMTEEEVIEAIQIHSRQFAKRQYTWFNNQFPVVWFDVFEDGWKEQLIQKVKEWLHE
ncbi:MAG: tRNA (adenosine(37)-N6)-dimethylallyltransferase MiaA [Erysipelotrichaceae bacterium]|nr:tRNA (adenosine(37)-N6)-dimethylallyltransferase MiaA [Erysipelotrichaceae bacterium]MBQ4343554.1 tRNA (adenosine(37)-N6)-dimethylallyltransferase MiaA [Erysipelotrichaceae bacterium]